MRRVCLGDVAVEYKGKAAADESSLPSVGLEHLVPESITLNQWNVNANNTFTKKFCKGHVLFGRRRAYLKKAAVAPIDGICSGDITVIAAKADQIWTRLLPFIIQNDYFFDYAVGESAGSLSPRVKWQRLKEFQFNLPSMERQREVADILWAMNDTLESYKVLLAKTDEMVKSQFIEMFGTPSINVKGYEISTLKEIAKGSLSYGSTAAAVDYDGLTRYVRITDITDDGRLNDDIKSAAKTEDKYILADGDILFARTGATVGKTARYREEFGRAIYAGFLIRLIPNTDIVMPDYVFYFTKSDYYADFVKGTQRVVAQPNINAQEYGDLQILVPPLSEQEKFVEFVNQSDKSKFALQQSIDSLQKLMKATINQEFMG